MSFEMREKNRKKRTRKVLEKRHHVRAETCFACNGNCWPSGTIFCFTCRGTGVLITEHFSPVHVDKKQPRLRYFK